MANRTAGYINSQTCPINPEHGIALRTDRGYYCPHVGHDPVKGKHTQNSWTLDEWETVKSGQPPVEPAQPAKPERAPNRRSRQTGRSKRRGGRSA